VRNGGLTVTDSSCFDLSKRGKKQALSDLIGGRSCQNTLGMILIISLRFVTACFQVVLNLVML